MNRFERRIRRMLNPYSTAFAMWWCHVGRRTRLARRIMAMDPARRRHQTAGEGTPGTPGRGAAVMAARRAAIDALLARDEHDR